MTDPAIIEAAALALQDECYTYLDDIEAPRLARAVLAAVTPLIEVAALEKAAKVAEKYKLAEDFTATEIAAEIRALIAKDSGDGD